MNVATGVGIAGTFKGCIRAAARRIIGHDESGSLEGVMRLIEACMEF